ncbi:hypothetical protein NDU88_004175 [Pleurodeles waltl]|uniref:Uncharacterized protein n=1 Tax=Pleurodeles waltl TaxID=8319 RepID=A0AAV7W4K2_PLEWA|nr:hypothetical protein NDU88_004175 [Pleurodeles waltl]
MLTAGCHPDERKNHERASGTAYYLPYWIAMVALDDSRSSWTWRIETRCEEEAGAVRSGTTVEWSGVEWSRFSRSGTVRHGTAERCRKEQARTTPCFRPHPFPCSE